MRSDKRDLFEALDYFEKSLTIFIELKDDLNIAKIRLNIAECVMSMEPTDPEISEARYKKCLQYLIQALPVLYKQGVDGHCLQCLRLLGTCYSSLHYYKLSVQCYTKLMTLCESVKDEDMLERGHFYLGKLYANELANPQKAVPHLLEALKISKTKDDNDHMATTHLLIGDCLLLENFPDEAQKHFQAALELKQDDGYQALILMDLARASTDDEMTQAYFEKSLSKLSSDRVKEGVAMNLGMQDYCGKRYASALRRLLESKEFFARAEFEVVYYGLGSVCLKVEKYDEAVEYFEVGMKIEKRFDEKGGLMRKGL